MNDDENNLKHSTSESMLSPNDDDDDVWCNPEDEVNLEHRIKYDQERIDELREILGNETLQKILEALEVK